MLISWKRYAGTAHGPWLAETGVVVFEPAFALQVFIIRRRNWGFPSMASKGCSILSITGQCHAPTYIAQVHLEDIRQKLADLHPFSKRS